MVNHAILLLGIILLAVSGCSAPPNKSEVEETIVKHYVAKGYKVVELDIGNIKSIDIGEKTYMGTPGYMIEILSLTLQPVENVGDVWNYKEGSKVTFRNARMLIQESRGTEKKWIISYISGIDAP